MNFRKMAHTAYFASLGVTILLFIYSVFQNGLFYFMIFLVVGGIGIPIGILLLSYVFYKVEIGFLGKYSHQFDTLPNILKLFCGICTFFRCGFYTLWIILPVTSPFRIISLYKLGISDDIFFIFLLSFYIFLFIIEYLILLVRGPDKVYGNDSESSFPNEVPPLQKMVSSDEFMKIDISEIEGVNFKEKNGKKYSTSLPSIKRIAVYIENKYHKTDYLEEELRVDYNAFINYYKSETHLSLQNFELVRNTFGGFVENGGEFKIIKKIR